MLDARRSGVCLSRHPLWQRIQPDAPVGHLARHRARYSSWRRAFLLARHAWPAWPRSLTIGGAGILPLLMPCNSYLPGLLVAPRLARFLCGWRAGGPGRQPATHTKNACEAPLALMSPGELLII